MFHKKGLSFDLFSDDSGRESIKATSQPELKANARKTMAWLGNVMMSCQELGFDWSK